MIKIIFLSIITFVLFSCNKNTTYVVTGVIKEIQIEENKLLIDHDIIPGFMEPMVMFFNIHENVDMDNFNENDSIKFNLVITENSHYSLNFEIVGVSKKNDDEEFLNDENDIYKAYKVGDKLSNVSFQTTDNKLFEFEKDISSKLSIISYIFSRCPMPDMCPAIISHNQFLANIYPDINFILLSFDYLYDTPSILLEEYGELENKYHNIKFLSSYNHYNDLVLLTKQSNLIFWGVDENNIGHTMRTLIIDKNNKIIKVYDGMDWKPGDVKNDIKNLLNLY